MSTRKNNFSKQKYEERIAQEINQFLRTSFSDPRLSLVTVTHVELNKDYSVAKVYWDTFDAGKEVMLAQLSEVLVVSFVQCLQAS